jgi:hypothetical protein
MDDDFLSTGTEQQAQMRNDAVDYAKLYVAAFVHTPAGAKLLADWDQRLLHKRIPVNAPHTEYAAVEAVRQFVHDIHAQIALAGTERT